MLNSVILKEYSEDVVLVDLVHKKHLRLPNIFKGIPGLALGDKKNLLQAFFADKLQENGICFEDVYEWPDLSKYIKVKSCRIEALDSCNMACKYCYNTSGNQNSSIIPTDKIIDSINELATFGLYTLIISGGEPTLHTGLVDIAKHGLNMGIANVCIPTNGLLLKGRLAKELISLPVNITVSLDGLTPETHDANRLQGSFTIVYKNLMDILGSERRCKIGINVTVTQQNFLEVDAIAKFAEEQNLDYLGICIPKKQGRADAEWENMKLTDEQQQYLYELASEKHNQHKGTMQVEGSHWNQGFNILFHKNVEVFNCRLGESVKIVPNGDIFCCAQTENPFFKIGSIYENTLTESLRSSKFVSVKKIVWERLSKIEKCQECEYQIVCQGGCPYEALDHYQEINRVDSFCETRQKILNEVIQEVYLNA